MLRFRILIGLIVTIVTCTVNAADWSTYTSKNFSIHSDQSSRKVNYLLKRFEEFRYIVLGMLGLPDLPENAKIKILVFNSIKEFESFASEDSIGYYLDTDNGPRIVVGPTGGVNGGIVESSDILFHEYVHYLLREHTNALYPRWYDEGFAEVLAATTMIDGKATIGAIPEFRVMTINNEPALRVHELLYPEVNSNSLVYLSRFYAYSWLLTHYIQISSLSEKPQLKQQYLEFLRRYNQDEEPASAFEASFHVSLEEMDTELWHYRSRHRLPVYIVDVPKYEGAITKSKLTINEQSFLLSDLALEIGDQSLALKYLENIDPEKPNAAGALSLLAVLENHQDNIEASKEAAIRANSIAPSDPVVLTNLSHWQWDNYDRARKNQSESFDSLASSLNFGKKALAQDANNLAAHKFVWMCQREFGDSIAAIQTMMSAYHLSPSNIDLNFTIGQYLVSLNKQQLARPFLLRVLNWSHSEELRTKSKALLQEIDNNKNSESEKTVVKEFEEDKD